MSSIGDKDIDDTIGTFDPKIDGLLDAFRWSAYAQKVMRFAITTSDENYEDTRDGLIDDYPDDIHEGISKMPQAMVDGILKAAEEFEKIVTFNFDNDQGAQNGARIRYGIADWKNAPDDAKDNPAYAYTPDEETGITDQRNWVSGDIFFDKAKFQNENPQVGTFAYHTILHETGHAMGLKHGHESEEFEDGFVRAALPKEWDSMEFTVMTYRSFIGQDLDASDGYTNPEGHYAQTLMMLDIAALQSQYGADFSTEKKNTVYSWNEKTGAYFIDGKQQWTPFDDVVFMTIWDGNGNDTYDLSNYRSDMTVDLAPGGWVDFGTQTAQLEVKSGKVTQESRANVFNALLYQDDTRSLIENAYTGSGNDKLSGNIAWNKLDGGAGNDTLSGGDGDDTLTGGDGQDDIDGGAGIDYAGYTAAKGVSVRIQRVGPAEDGAWNVTGFIGAKDDDLRGVEGFVFGGGKDFIEIRGAPEIDIFAGGGDDTIQGGGADAMLVGGKGTDTVVVTGEGAFQAFGGDVSADGVSLGQKSQNDVLRIDLDFDNDGFFLAVVDPTKMSLFSDFAGSNAEGFTRVDFRGRDGGDSVDGGVGADTMRGDDGDDRLTGYGGDDELFGGGDDDGLSGGTGDDKITGDDGDDRIDGEDGNDTLSGGDGNDEIYGGEGNDLITTGGGGDFIAEGDAGNDTITGAGDAETFFGDEGNDVLSGAGGKDILQGGVGDDTIEGGAGDDTLIGGDGGDRFVFAKDFGTDTLNDFDAAPKGGQDQIDLRAFGFEDFRDFQKSVSFSGGGTVTIDFGKDGALKLFDVSRGDLDSADFLF
ncbi:M10 family metallopeptidase C-terminal domain-containing protein [Hansschlegelia zhihuaiae]|uniref:Peptidase M10 serralysin C-terminal domain-containing protein n=1 Tax=Hansschlegelia zhihuaiae TaxID=405005 RepID=A0A4Q0MJD6_9HYPH|nr:M10 family metallopeptidase C-terminal domain-containing protein [Hansschlegelia zhihuaiae]RXF73674.1 hypothetical protein EK403_08750 [Hansschlegelia zhihuaiae]